MMSNVIMINKIVISAAGKGTRMRELARSKPKHLIEVAGKPFLYYALENIVNAGYEHLILVVGHEKEKMEEFLKKYPFPATLVNQEQFLGPEEYGTACPIKAAESFVAGEQFVSVNGDDLYGVEDLKRFRVEDEWNYIGGIHSDHPEQFGVLNVGQDDLLKHIEEKPKVPQSDLVNTSLFKFTAEIFAAVKGLSVSSRGEYELTDAVNELARQNKVKVRRMRDYWLPFSRPEHVLEISNHLKNEGRA